MCLYKVDLQPHRGEFHAENVVAPRRRRPDKRPAVRGSALARGEKADA
jgi:hypothetical protein